jgi:membrane protein YdbS with pleckstrin-like domain
MKTMKTKKINKLNHKLKFSEVLFTCMLILMALGLLGAIASTFIWVWIGWQLAWKIGLSGILLALLSGLGWAIIYNLTNTNNYYSH